LVVIYFYITGQLPFTAEYELSLLYTIINEDPVPLREKKPNLPEKLESVLVKALKKDKEERYQDLNTFVADLEKLR